MKTSEMQVTLIDSMGTDLSVVDAARVSFDKVSDWEWVEINGSDEPVLSVADAKLIRYLAKHKHTSPFNHAFMSFRVKAPIFVARQLVKHSFLVWNEVSRRYVDSEPEFYIPEMWRKRAENVKQGSGEQQIEENYWAVGAAESLSENCLSYYQALLSEGVCPEQARMVLPQNTMTEWIWSGSLGAFARMCVLRLDSHAQKETREVAEKVAAHAKELFPVAWKELMENS